MRFQDLDLVSRRFLCGIVEVFVGVVFAVVVAVVVSDHIGFPAAESGSNCMICAHPRMIRLPASVKTAGLESGLMVPCGVCMPCRIQRTREWTVRLMHELPYWNHASFVTLTYSDDFIPKYYGTLQKDDLQKFFKRLRKSLCDRKLKYFAAGEYGDKTNRPHYHIIFFGVGLNKSDKQLVNAAWPYGRIHFGMVERKSIQYVCGYIQKKWTGKKAENEYGLKESPFQLVSKGLGEKFIKQFGDKVLSRLDITIEGKHVGIPRYYKRKLQIPTESLAELALESESETEADIIRQIGSDDEYLINEELFKRWKQREVNTLARISLHDKIL